MVSALTRLSRAIPPDQCIPASSLEAQLRIAKDLGAFTGGLSLPLSLSSRLFAGARGDNDVKTFNVKLESVNDKSWQSLLKRENLPRGSWGSQCESASAYTILKSSRRTRQRWTSWCFCLCGHFAIDEAPIGCENCKKGEVACCSCL